MAMQRQFTQLSRAWHAEANLKGVEYTDNIMFGMYEPGDGCEYELGISWYPIGGGKPTAQLEIFEDGFKALADMPDVFAAMFVALLATPNRAVESVALVRSIVKSVPSNVPPITSTVCGLSIGVPFVAHVNNQTTTLSS